MDIYDKMAYGDIPIINDTNELYPVNPKNIVIYDHNVSMDNNIPDTYMVPNPNSTTVILQNGSDTPDIVPPPPITNDSAEQVVTETTPAKNNMGLLIVAGIVLYLMYSKK